MKRCSFTLRIRPGMEEAYRQRHAVVWPEVMEALETHDIHNYSIYLSGDRVFAYFETTRDGEETFRSLHEDPALASWRDSMSDIVIRDKHMGFQFLTEVFHLD